MVKVSIRRVVGGKVYDTAKAEEVVVHWNGVPHGRVSHEHLGLYCTTKGAWFVAGRTGARGRFGRLIAEGTQCGEGVEPVSAVEAMALLEGWEESDVIERHFADRIAEA